MDIMQTYGAKEMYDIDLRLNDPIEVLGRKYEINESLIRFKVAEISNIYQKSSDTAARGGYNNNPLVWWETDKQTDFILNNGVLSPISWSLLSNSKINSPKSKSIQYYEDLKTIEDYHCCFIDLKFIPNCQDRLGAQPNPNNEPLPMGRRPELMLKPLPPSKTRWLFCYDKETGKRINDILIDGNRLYFKQYYREILVDYTTEYVNGIITMEVGSRLINGFLRLSGKMSLKNENSGEVTTAILEMPKIRLSTNLSIRLGKDCDSSTVSNFSFVGFPDETRRREEQSVCYISYLDKELSGDYI